MKSRLQGLPPYRAFDSVVDARHFNQVHLGLRRLGSPLRFELPHVRGMDLYLDEEVWICADRTINDLPVVAWSHFQRGRRSLHLPIHCRVRFFHQHAGLIVTGLLRDLEQLLAEQLAVGRYSRGVTALYPRDGR